MNNGIVSCAAYVRRELRRGKDYSPIHTNYQRSISPGWQTIRIYRMDGGRLVYFLRQTEEEREVGMATRLYVGVDGRLKEKQIKFPRDSIRRALLSSSRKPFAKKLELELTE